MEKEKHGANRTILRQENEKQTERKPGEADVENHLLCDPPLQESSKVVLSEVINEEEMEKVAHELRDCLPTWVTQEQISHLVSSWGRNTVEIVNDFYERETEFYEQIPTSTSSESETSLAEVLALISQPDSFKSSEVIHSGQAHKPQNVLILMKNGVSPGKRKKKITSKAVKKAKSHSKMDSSGPKQCTITKFFNKVASNESSS